MKRILKLALPPLLAILLVAGYGSGTIQTIAKTITTMVPTIVTITTEVGESSIEGWTFIEEIAESDVSGSIIGYKYKHVKTIQELIPTDVDVSDKTVPDEKPRSNYDRFQDKISKIIADAEKQIQTDSTAANATSDPIVLDTGEWVSFKGDVYQKLQDSGRPIQITFRYKGKHWRVDIPAGADLMSLVDENGYCGFMNLVAHFGGTELED